MSAKFTNEKRPLHSTNYRHDVVRSFITNNPEPEVEIRWPEVGSRRIHKPFLDAASTAAGGRYHFRSAKSALNCTAADVVTDYIFRQIRVTVTIRSK